MNEPKLVSGDGALGAWAALRDVFPQAKEQRCWVHKTANVLDALPKRLQPRAKSLLHEMAEAPTRADARLALERFREEFDAKYPKAVEKLDRDWAQLTAFFDFPAEHWRHLRTTNPIESSFATVKLRTRVTKGAGSKTAALAMAYKLLDAAQERWQRFNGHELVADVLNGVTFKDGVRVENSNFEKETEKVAARRFSGDVIHNIWQLLNRTFRPGKRTASEPLHHAESSDGAPRRCPEADLARARTSPAHASRLTEPFPFHPQPSARTIVTSHNPGASRPPRPPQQEATEGQQADQPEDREEAPSHHRAPPQQPTATTPTPHH